MSKLSRQLNIILKTLKKEKLTYSESILNWVDHNRLISKIRDYYYDIRAFVYNLPMFVKFAWGYRSWDSVFIIEILVKLLKDHALNLNVNNRHVDSRKCSRRAYTAAGLLRKAYLENFENKTFKYLYKKYSYSFLKNYTPPPKGKVRIIEGMRTAAMKREDKAVKELKEQAWKYLHKHIEQFWD